jgi:hypothetical protein
MRGRKNPPLEIHPVPEGTPLTFDIMAQAYLEDYVLQRYRSLSTARPRSNTCASSSAGGRRRRSPPMPSVVIELTVLARGWSDYSLRPSTGASGTVFDRAPSKT